MTIHSMATESKAPMEAVLVEYPPVAMVVMACATASKTPMPAKESMVAQAAVKNA